VAATPADGQSVTSQTTPNTENQAKKSRWDGDEDKKISEIVKLQYVYQCLTRFGTFNPLPSGLGT
jgi:plasmid replication initiation protein